MDKIVNFQLSLFGSFINIQPDTDIAMHLMSHLADENMIPATATVNTVDPLNKNITTENRMQMVSQDKNWIIVFFQERIDVTYAYVGGDNVYTSISDVCDKAITLLKKTFASFAGTTGNRLAVNGRVILNAMSDEEKKAFIRRFSTPLSLHANESLEEWNLHYNAKREMKITDDKSELCNSIVDLGEIIAINSTDESISNRMSIGFDINTAPENQEARFKYTDLESFALSARIEMEKLLLEIEEG